MRVLLVGINAKFSHTNLAIRSLSHALKAASIPAEIAEYTINQPAREILAEIVSRRPDVLLFSCYIWNIAFVRQIGADFRLLFPAASILLGGPEVSFDPEEQLAALPFADAILAGEGETIVADVLFVPHPKGVYRPAQFADLDALPFPYDDLPALQNRVLYYEASRGCPFGCSYCLSSADKTVRFRSLPLVYADLQRFLDAQAMQVKFVDRTFNLDPRRALAIWRYIAAHDNGFTSFQMELGGDLTTPEALEFLSTVRPGLFQFEIGIQSTSDATLTEICRKTDLEKLRRNVAAVKAAGNIHQHLDLIAGLPLESFARFAESFDDVYAMVPEQLQLGFLKLLRGSSLYANRAQYGLVHSETPPYEILRTPQLSFEELTRLGLVEEMTEVYYNSGRFTHTLAYMMEREPSPFWALLRLGEAMPKRKIAKYEYYDLLYQSCILQNGNPEICRWLLKYDLCLHERPRKLPDCCAGAPLAAKYRRALAQLKLSKTAHVEVFPFDVTNPGREPVETILRFDYERPDLSGHAAWEKISL